MHYHGLKEYYLDNGLRVLIKEEHAVPHVSVQMWYNVGSKDEQSGEKGLAHLLEHMIFKGTQRLSESDINVITHKLSGYTNAFTSYDYTGYMFDFPVAHWQTALDMLADCMTSCTFKEDLLQSELKAVIQELKMYNDDYQSTLIERMTGAIFADHPYHNPIIGYKSDLCAITQQGLLAFYAKYYVPSNATLVIVGDIDAQRALADVKKHFEHIPAQQAYERPAFYAQEDIAQTAITLYRDIQRPILLYAWRVPGSGEQKELYVRIIAELVGGQTSALYRRLVDDLQIATDVQMFLDDLFEYGLLFLSIEPVDTQAIDRIRMETEQIMARLQTDELDSTKLTAAYAQLRMEHLLMLEKNQDHAYALGKYTLASNDPTYVYTMMDRSLDEITTNVRALIQRWLSPTAMHEGRVLPLQASQKDHWQVLQQEQDRTDAYILDRKVRTTAVEPPLYATHVHKHTPDIIASFVYTTFELGNGLRLLLVPSEPSEKAEIMVTIDEIVDEQSPAQQGIVEFMCALMQEGTAQYSKIAFMDTLQAHGIQLSIQAGVIMLTCFKQDIALALQLLQQMLLYATFESHAVEKIRQQLQAALDEFWDTPTQFVAQHARAYVYQGHPWSYHKLGTPLTIAALTRDELLTCYRTRLTPGRTRITIVSDVADTELKTMVEDLFGTWSTPSPSKVVYPVVHAQPPTQLAYPINRDQVVLAYAGISITRNDPRFAALQLFDQILIGGTQLSMSSRLFGLREQTGLFYTIGGSMLAGAGDQPGMRYVRTIVSNDRLAEAERAITECIMQTIEHIEHDEHVAAQDAVLHALIDQCGLQKSRAQFATFLDVYRLPHTYIGQRMQEVRELSIQQVRNAAAEICSPASLTVIKAGRI